MFGYIKESKLIEQERLFEEKLSRIKNTHQLEIDLLKLDLQHEQQILKLAQANEKLLDDQNKYLSDELRAAKSMSFPSKKFNVKKAVNMLTTDLSSKALATFLHQLVESLGDSHLATLNGYLLRKLTTNSQLKEQE